MTTQYFESNRREIIYDDPEPGNRTSDEHEGTPNNNEIRQGYATEHDAALPP